MVQKYERPKYEGSQEHEGQSPEQEVYLAAMGWRRRLKGWGLRWRWYRRVGPFEIGQQVVIGDGGLAAAEIERIGLRVAYQERDCRWTVWLRRRSGRVVKVMGDGSAMPCIRMTSGASCRPASKEKRRMGTSAGSKREGRPRAAVARGLGR